MAYQTFKLSSASTDAEAEVLNGFLRSRRVLAIRKEWMNQAAEGGWSFCVEYEEGSAGRAVSAGQTGKRLLDLFVQILHAHAPGSARGLPIGSLVSQHCANLYLDGVDRLVTERLGHGRYVRYMDDFTVWADDKRRLKAVRETVRDRLAERGLAFKQEPQLNRVLHGMDFLGHRVFATHIEPNRRSRVRFVRKLRGIERDLTAGNLAEWEAQRKLGALCAFVGHFGSASWRRRAMLSSGCGP